MRIAILGAGNAGTCAALELARHGRQVDLFDDNETPISRASFHNEGKVHLGFLYAKDRSLRTARLMLEGALGFADLVNRWTGGKVESLNVSTPFYYGVHVGTMVDVDALAAHYGHCERIFDEIAAATKGRYLGVDASMSVQRLSSPEMERLVDSRYFHALFRATERSVDPRTLAPLLRGAALAESRIHFIGRSRITGVERTTEGALAVTFSRDGASHTESYDQVVNCLWHGRLAIDQTVGLAPEFPWMNRYKFANRVSRPIANGDLPSLTCVLGPFGDIVNYGPKGLFLSWYPEGMIGTSTDLEPPDWDRQLSAERRAEVFQRSHAEWLKRCPELARYAFAKDEVDPGGGVIFAWGDSDVQDPCSKLHDRYDVGVYSTGNYHTVNTGKYTLSLLMGKRAAERVMGIA